MLLTSNTAIFLRFVGLLGGTGAYAWGRVALVARRVPHHVPANDDGRIRAELLHVPANHKGRIRAAPLHDPANDDGRTQAAPLYVPANDDDRHYAMEPITR